LYLAAKRGVRVRLLVDDTLAHGDEQVLLALDTHPNFDVHVYNPKLNIGKSTVDVLVNIATDFRGVNQRMHNKNIIIDGSYVITGGRNIGEEYFDMDSEYNFRDRDVFLYGQTQAIGVSFDEFWDSPLSVPINLLLKPQKEEEKNDFLHQLKEYACNPLIYPYEFRKRIAQIPALLRDRERSKALQWVDSIEYVSDAPIKNKTDNLQGGGLSTKGLITLLKNAKRRVWIQTPYLVMTDVGLQLFSRLRERGIEVQIITNSLAATDSYAAFNGYQQIRPTLLEMGVELYEFKPDAEILGVVHSSGYAHLRRTPHGLHAKSMIIDDDKTIITTFNLDPRSANLNTENYTLITSSIMNDKLTAMFDMEMRPENSWKISKNFNPDKEGGFVKNLWTFFSRVVPLSLL
jgi:putative cardiolipin synthase